jgi:hypothetical protein
MADDEGDKRVKIVHDLIPADWNKGPISLAHELRQMLKGIVDEGTGIDSGGGDGIADLWPVIGGVEYHIQISAKPKVQS